MPDFIQIIGVLIMNGVPSLAHIINPVVVPESSDLFIAQPITFESMKRAKEYAKEKINVELYSAHYNEDTEIIPEYFHHTRVLTRSSLDIPNNVSKKKLPYIKDIFDRLYESSSADYFIYTNVDIGLNINFYSSICYFIKEGFDTLSITRRTLPGHYKSISELTSIYKEKGKPHPGWDCFVFRRDLLPKFLLDDIFIGAPGIGRVLLCNLIFYGQNYSCFTDKHLTFHIGDDGDWKKALNSNSPDNFLNKENKNNSYKIIRHLNKTTTDITKKQALKVHVNELILAIHPTRKLFYKFLHKIRI